MLVLRLKPMAIAALVTMLHNNLIYLADGHLSCCYICLQSARAAAVSTAAAASAAVGWCSPADLQQGKP
jgi:hypothetical protein